MQSLFISCVRACVAFRSATNKNWEQIFLDSFSLYCVLCLEPVVMLAGPISQTERALCHIHCRQTPNSLKLCIFLVAASHCLKRMERLQYIMRSCGCFLSLLVFYSYVFLYYFSSLLRLLLRFIILSQFHSVFFFCSSF
jgi:hypothetical protein